MDQIVPLQELVIYFIDYVAEQMALTREARNKVERNRKGADAALVKELLGDKQEVFIHYYYYYFILLLLFFI